MIEVGKPRPASAIPLAAAAVRTPMAMVFVVEDDVAHARVVPLHGEREGLLFHDPAQKPGTQVVMEGRALLQDGDRVSVGAVEDFTPQRPAPQAHAGTQDTGLELTP